MLCSLQLPLCKYLSSYQCQHIKWKSCGASITFPLSFLNCFVPWTMTTRQIESKPIPCKVLAKWLPSSICAMPGDLQDGEMIYSVYAMALSRMESFCISTAVISPGTFEIRFHCQDATIDWEKVRAMLFPTKVKNKSKKNLKYNAHVLDHSILKCFGRIYSLRLCSVCAHMLSWYFFNVLFAAGHTYFMTG